MLLNNFFKIKDIQQTDKHTVTIELNASHSIYEGHFPNNPITPGVCMTQMVKESLEVITEKKLMLVSGSNIKFMAVWNPLVHPLAMLTISLKEKDDHLLYADSSIFSGETIFFTFKGSFKEN